MTQLSPGQLGLYAACPMCGRPTKDPLEDRPGLAHADGPETMREAARRAEPRSGTQRGQILTLFYQRQRYGWTDDELEVATGWAHQTVSARRNELSADGHIHATKEWRNTRRNRRADVYGITALGVLCVEAWPAARKASR